MQSFGGRIRGATLAALLALLVLLVQGGFTVASAAVCDNWTGNAGDGNWFTAGNWDGGIPSSGTDACIQPSVSQTITISGATAQAASLQLSGATLRIASQGFTPTSLTLSGGGSNAGTIVLDSSTSTGGAVPKLAVSGGTLTNTGTLVVPSNPSMPIPGGLSGTVVNSGKLEIDGELTLDPGTTITQTAGTTNLAPHAFVGANNDGPAFRLNGGILSGGGSSANQDEAGSFVHVAVVNTGGTVMPGSATQPGQLIFQTYTQMGGGTLDIRIARTQNGSARLGMFGSATVGGTLAVTTVSGPSVGTTYGVVVANGTVSGRFAKVTGLFPNESAFPPGWTAGYHLMYVPNSAELSADPASGLRVRVKGPGSVTSSPAGISCTSRCDAPLFKTQTVKLTERPRRGWAFRGWSGDCTGPDRTCSVSMSKARSVTATFARHAARH